MSEARSGLDVGRLGRLLALIGFVSAVFLLTSGVVLSGVLYQIGVVVIGSVALVTAIVGFLVAASETLG
jgi:hypothetical protein